MAENGEMTIDADVDNLPEVEDFIEGRLEEAGCPPKVISLVLIAAEEMYVNIAHYAYSPNKGQAFVRCRILDHPRAAEIRFRDSGVPFNPLAKKDADITLSAEERDIGGLGILMVKKSMDHVEYRYEDEQNIFTMIKNF